MVMCVCCKSAYAEHLLYPRHFPTPDELLAYAEHISSTPAESDVFSLCVPLPNGKPDRPLISGWLLGQFLLLHGHRTFSVPPTPCS